MCFSLQEPTGTCLGDAGEMPSRGGAAQWNKAGGLCMLAVNLLLVVLSLLLGLRAVLRDRFRVFAPDRLLCRRPYVSTGLNRMCGSGCTHHSPRVPLRLVYRGSRFAWEHRMRWRGSKIGYGRRQQPARSGNPTWWAGECMPWHHGESLGLFCCCCCWW